MFFKDAKQGTPIYVLDRNSLTVKTGTVTSVSLPHFNTNLGVNNPQGMVIDVGINVDGQIGSYQIKDTSVICTTNTLTITPNTENLLEEIRGIKSQLENIINNFDTYKGKVSKCDKLLSEYDPTFKYQRETDKKLSTLEKAILSLTESNQKLSKIIEQNGLK